MILILIGPKRLHPLGEIEPKQWTQISTITIFINIAEILRKYCMKVGQI